MNKESHLMSDSVIQKSTLGQQNGQNGRHQQEPVPVHETAGTQPQSQPKQDLAQPNSQQHDHQQIEIRLEVDDDLAPLDPPARQYGATSTNLPLLQSNEDLSAPLNNMQAVQAIEEIQQEPLEAPQEPRRNLALGFQSDEDVPVATQGDAGGRAGRVPSPKSDDDHSVQLVADEDMRDDEEASSDDESCSQASGLKQDADRAGKSGDRGAGLDEQRLFENFEYNRYKDGKNSQQQDEPANNRPGLVHVMFNEHLGVRPHTGKNKNGQEAKGPEVKQVGANTRAELSNQTNGGIQPESLLLASPSKRVETDRLPQSPGQTPGVSPTWRLKCQQQQQAFPGAASVVDQGPPAGEQVAATTGLTLPEPTPDAVRTNQLKQQANLEGSQNQMIAANQDGDYNQILENKQNQIMNEPQNNDEQAAGTASGPQRPEQTGLYGPAAVTDSTPTLPVPHVAAQSEPVQQPAPERKYWETDDLQASPCQNVQQPVQAISPENTTGAQINTDLIKDDAAMADGSIYVDLGPAQANGLDVTAPLAQPYAEQNALLTAQQQFVESQQAGNNCESINLNGVLLGGQAQTMAPDLDASLNSPNKKKRGRPANMKGPGDASRDLQMPITADGVLEPPAGHLPPMPDQQLMHGINQPADAMMMDAAQYTQPEAPAVVDGDDSDSPPPRPHKTYDINTIFRDFKDFPDNKWEPYADKRKCPSSSFTDARGIENGERMERLLKGGTDKPLLFDLQNSWLKGEQYAHILQNQDRYCQVFGVKKYDQKQHPETIYIDPLDGLLYFVEGATIGSDFGFPRLGIRKRFKWKKMNFTTDLPKRDPLVSYIVASAVKCEKFFPGSNDDGPVYRMHAVILKKKDPKLQLPDVASDAPVEADADAQAQSKASLGGPEGQNLAPSDQQPRSSHGRVLTQSRKLKAALHQSGSEGNTPKGAAGQASQSQAPARKNYILCHVRRVMGRRDEDEQPEGAPLSGLLADDAEKGSEAGEEKAVSKDGAPRGSKIPNKGRVKQALDVSTAEIVSPSSLEQQAAQLKDIKKLGSLDIFKKMSFEEIKKLKISVDGKPLSNYMINKYIKPQMQTQQDKDTSVSRDEPASASASAAAGRGRKRGRPCGPAPGEADGEEVKAAVADAGASRKLPRLEKDVVVKQDADEEAQDTVIEIKESPSAKSGAHMDDLPGKQTPFGAPQVRQDSAEVAGSKTQPRKDNTSGTNKPASPFPTQNFPFNQYPGLDASLLYGLNMAAGQAGNNPLGNLNFNFPQTAAAQGLNPIQSALALQNHPLLMQSPFLSPGLTSNLTALLLNPVQQQQVQLQMLSGILQQQQAMNESALENSALPQLAQTQSQQYSRKRDAKFMKKYESHKLGETTHGHALLGTNSPMLPGARAGGVNAPGAQRSSTNHGGMNAGVSPQLGPLGAGGLLGLPSAGQNGGITGSGARERSHSRRLTAEGQSLTDVSFQNHGHLGGDYNRRFSDNNGALLGTDMKNGGNHGAPDSPAGSRKSRDLLYSTISGGILKSPNLGAPGRPSPGDVGGNLRGSVGFNAGALNASLAGLAADRSNNAGRQQRKHSLLSGLGRNRVNSAFKKLDAGHNGVNHGKDVRGSGLNASPLQAQNELDYRRDSGFFDSLSGMPGNYNKQTNQMQQRAHQGGGDHSFGQVSRYDQNSLVNTSHGPLNRNLSSDEQHTTIRNKADKLKDDCGSSQNTANFNGNNRSNQQGLNFQQLDNYSHLQFMFQYHAHQQQMIKQLLGSQNASNSQQQQQAQGQLYNSGNNTNPNALQTQMQQRSYGSGASRDAPGTTSQQQMIDMFNNQGQNSGGTNGASTEKKEGGSRMAADSVGQGSGGTDSGQAMQINFISSDKIQPVLQGVFFNQSFGSGSNVNQFHQQHSNQKRKLSAVRGDHQEQEAGKAAASSSVIAENSSNTQNVKTGRPRGESGMNALRDMLRTALAPPTSNSQNERHEQRTGQQSINMIIHQPMQGGQQGFNPKDSLIGAFHHKRSIDRTRLSFQLRQNQQQQSSDNNNTNSQPQDRPNSPFLNQHKLSISAAVLKPYGQQNQHIKPMPKVSGNFLGYKAGQSSQAENSSNKEPLTGSDEKIIFQNSALRKSPAVEQSD